MKLKNCKHVSALMKLFGVRESGIGIEVYVVGILSSTADLIGGYSGENVVIYKYTEISKDDKQETYYHLCSQRDFFSSFNDFDIIDSREVDLSKNTKIKLKNADKFYYVIKTLDNGFLFCTAVQPSALEKASNITYYIKAEDTVEV